MELTNKQSPQSIPGKISLSKTDVKGIIEYVNEHFLEVSGFSRSEILGKPHNIVRHPDMPKVAFKLMWDTIQKGETFHAIVKNKTKNGGFYWVLARVEPKKDEEGNIISYFSQRKSLPEGVVEKVEKYYNILLDIEKDNKLEVSEKYFYGLLEEMNLTYDKFVLKILNFTPEQLTNYFSDAKVFNLNTTNTNHKSKPIPNNREVKVDPSQIIMSRTDLKGIIQYSNDYFVKIAEYNHDELMGQPHNIIRHPDMPKVVFKLMWEKLKNGEGLFAIVKNMTKSGGFYWVLARIEPVFNILGEIDHYVSYRKAVPQKAVERIEKYYQILSSIEAKKNLQTSEIYFKGFLDDNKLTYDQFILKILGTNEATLNQYFEGLIKTKTESQEAETFIPKTTKADVQDVEIQIHPISLVKTKTNSKGVIEFANEYFFEITGYKDEEIIGEMHSIVRHPDTPKTIFKLLWDQLLMGKSFNLAVKNLTKEGKYYWLLNHIQPIKDSNGKILGYQSYGKAVPKESVPNFQLFYNQLKDIEQKQGLNASYNYLIDFMADNKQTYDDWLIQTLNVKKEFLTNYFSNLGVELFETSEEKKSLFKKWFG